MIYTGIDYSLTSPAVCVYNDAHPFSFYNCQFYVMSDKKLKCQLPANMYFQSHPKWHDTNERYHNIASFFIPNIESSKKIYIEDYAFAAKGKVFHIAENTQVLQYNLWKKNIYYSKISPATLKKFATGKGNANKEAMYESFKEQETVDLKWIFGLKKTDSPISDIVDAFFLCKYAVSNL